MEIPVELKWLELQIGSGAYPWGSGLDHANNGGWRLFIKELIRNFQTTTTDIQTKPQLPPEELNAIQSGLQLVPLNEPDGSKKWGDVFLATAWNRRLSPRISTPQILDSPVSLLNFVPFPTSSENLAPVTVDNLITALQPIEFSRDGATTETLIEHVGDNYRFSLESHTLLHALDLPIVQPKTMLTLFELMDSASSALDAVWDFAGIGRLVLTPSALRPDINICCGRDHGNRLGQSF